MVSMPIGAAVNTLLPRPVASCSPHSGQAGPFKTGILRGKFLGTFHPTSMAAARSPSAVFAKAV
jgi:hypothetical protein